MHVRLLFDHNLSGSLVHRLADVFPGSCDTRSLGIAAAPDTEVRRTALALGAVLVSQDAGFLQMVEALGAPPKLVWLRCGNKPTREIERLLRAHAERIEAMVLDPGIDCLEIF